MANLSVVLKLAAPVFVLVGLLHLVFGAGAEVMLGAEIDASTLSDPVVDSQNRFYGVAFTAYGFLMFLCAMDLEKYQTVLRVLLWTFFAAGCARIVSIVTHGLPSELVLGLLATELVLPPLALFWLSRSLNSNGRAVD